jgi:hypothetical protein
VLLVWSAGQLVVIALLVIVNEFLPIPEPGRHASATESEAYFIGLALRSYVVAGAAIVFVAGLAVLRIARHANREQA